MTHHAAQEPRDELIFLTSAEVQEKVGLSKTALHRRRRTDPNFPKPVVLSKGDGRRRSIRWVKHEIESWMQKQIDSRD